MQAKREQSQREQSELEDSTTASQSPRSRVAVLKVATKAMSGRPKELFRADSKSELHGSVQAMVDQALQARA